MIIDTDKIPHEGKHFEGQEDLLIIDKDDNWRVSGKLCYNLNAQVVSDNLIVQGTLGVDMSLRCSMCGDFFSLRLEDNSFCRTYELLEQFSTSCSHDSSKSVDLTDDISEAMLLVLPAYPVCTPDCKGLCSQCGINLNNNKCKCTKSNDPRWSVLNNLKDL